MPCYVLQAGDTQMVKLGWATSDVERRRRALQCAHYEPLRVIRTIHAGRWAESQMHQRFADRHVRNEWYRFHPNMLSITVEELTPPRLSDLLSAADIETRAKAAALSIGEICKRADIALSTFYRWKAGKTNPSIDVYRRLCEVTEPTTAGAAA